MSNNRLNIWKEKINELQDIVMENIQTETQKKRTFKKRNKINQSSPGFGIVSRKLIMIDGIPEEVRRANWNLSKNKSWKISMLDENYGK